MILTNGNIVTMAGPEERASSLNVAGEHIIAFDPEADPSEPTIDLRGYTVIPGFCDAHAHFHYWAKTLDHLDFDCVGALKDALRMVSERVAATPKGEWIEGRGFNQNLWDPPVFPSRLDLDLVAPEHPVAIFSKDEHTYWVNSAALAAAGITPETPDPHGGRIVRDDAGEAVGLFTETACRLIERILPEPSPEATSEAMTRAAARLHRLGITAVHDMGDLNAWKAYGNWSDRSLDVVKYIPVEDAEVVIRAGLTSGDGTPRLILGGLKLFADGALGSHTAYMFEPYCDAPDNIGMPRLSPQEMADYLRMAEANSLACAIHAIGDRANSEVIEIALKQGTQHVRHRLEHAQLGRHLEQQRLAVSGWVASVQPTHLLSDRDTVLRVWGEERARYAYPFGSLAQLGVPLAFGSDMPIDPPDPLLGIYAACCRKHPEDERGAMEPDLSMERYDALRAATLGGAYAAGMERDVGTLSPGKRANFVILDRDILAVPDAELPGTRVLATFVAGAPVYLNAEAAPELADILATQSV